MTLPPFGDIASRQVGFIVDPHRPKRTWIGTGLPAGSPPQPCLMPVSTDSRGMSIMPMLTEITHISRTLLVPLFSMTAMVTMAVTVGSSSSSPQRMEPLRVSSRYVCGAIYPLRSSLLLLDLFLNSKGDFWAVGVIPRQLRSFIGWPCTQRHPRTRH
jgi:hypothetical protein